MSVRNTVNVLGLAIDNVSIVEAVSRIAQMIDHGGSHQVATANSDFLTNALSDSSVLSILSGCDLVIPDGMPLVWISKLFGTPLRQRVTGVDLVYELARLSALRGNRIFLLGSSEANLFVAPQKFGVLVSRGPGVRTVFPQPWTPG
jgi:N-acetylglucosaminyldiphosphoundecaprenol N-acetyl-beta-D-mannosaminyltransferase